MPLRIEAVGPRGLLRREVGRGGLSPLRGEREEEVLPADDEGLDRPLAYVVAHLDVPVGKTMETDKKKHELGRFMTLEEAAEAKKVRCHRVFLRFHSATRYPVVTKRKDSKSGESNLVPVRFRPWAPSSKDTPGHGWEFFIYSAIPQI